MNILKEYIYVAFEFGSRGGDARYSVEAGRNNVEEKMSRHARVEMREASNGKIEIAALVVESVFNSAVCDSAAGVKKSGLLVVVLVFVADRNALGVNRLRKKSGEVERDYVVDVAVDILVVLLLSVRQRLDMFVEL